MTETVYPYSTTPTGNRHSVLRERLAFTAI